MFQPLSDRELREFREGMGSPLRELARDAARIDDPAELEFLAAEFCPSLLLVKAPELAAELIALIGQARGGLSLLLALSAAAPPPFSALATDAVARLGDGPVSLAARRAGTLVPEHAFALDLEEPVSSVLIACRRPGVPGFQILGFTFEWPESGGAIKDAFATAAIEAESVERALHEPARILGIQPERITIEVAAGRVAAGAARCAAVGFGPGRDALIAVTLLLRAACRPDADELLEPLVGLPALADESRRRPGRRTQPR